MAQTKDKIQKQILLTCRTHEMIKDEFPEYSQISSKVKTNDFHITLGIMNSNLKPNGFQLYIGNNVSYNNYKKMLEYLFQNPLKENVFLKMKENIEKNETL